MGRFQHRLFPHRLLLTAWMIHIMQDPAQFRPQSSVDGDYRPDKYKLGNYLPQYSPYPAIQASCHHLFYSRWRHWANFPHPLSRTCQELPKVAEENQYLERNPGIESSLSPNGCKAMNVPVYIQGFVDADVCLSFFELDRSTRKIILQEVQMDESGVLSLLCSLTSQM